MGRAPCCDKANVKKGPWSPEEDATLKAYIEQKGTGGNWIALPQKIGLKRCGKSCRLRWLNYLRPNIKHGGFTEEEENIICSLYLSIGSRWSIIAAQLPGRTDNDIKNYWNTRLKKKLMAKQRKEQTACRIIEQEIKRESETFMVNQTLNQVPYWAEQQTSMPMMHPSLAAHHLGNQDQLTRLLTKIGGQFYDDSQLINNSGSYQYPTQDQLYVLDLSNAQASSAVAINSTTNVNFTQWLNTEYDVNGVSMNMHQGQESFPPEFEAYFSNQSRFDGNESYSGVEVGNNSSTTSNSAGSNSWEDMSSLVNTPASSFDAYQNGML
ncbi:transcription factor RAX3-like [Chenopodium quinoa]|uniref:Uncharacterized protein n=1 Tax=Chenopodium quinoa TaxID=63459 RepID=A0A803L6R9_CHEQI|nr:transcription factor RAX3-like [Chenopodium quinoa]